MNRSVTMIIVSLLLACELQMMSLWGPPEHPFTLYQSAVCWILAAFLEWLHSVAGTEALLNIVVEAKKRRRILPRLGPGLGSSWSSKT